MPVPTPAGHQAELNYIYSMVEELSRQLADNRRVTEDIVSGLGRVRNKAKTQSLANDDVIDAAAQDINGGCPGLGLWKKMKVTVANDVRPRTKSR